MPRFVLLRHELPPEHARPSHWDLMLERHGVLWTWALTELPTAWIDPSQRQQTETLDAPRADWLTAERLADHRLAYLDYEGPVHGERGEVTRYDAGTYEMIREGVGEVAVQIRGVRIQDVLTLRQSEEASTSWQLHTQPAPPG